jgi:hypothetical protein
MTTYNTITPRQSIKDQDYRGSYTMHLTPKQFQFIMEFANSLDIELDALWEAWFEEDYQVGNWRDISINAASELIDHLIKIQVTQRALMRKVTRTEQEQHDYEMGWGF